MKQTSSVPRRSAPGSARIRVLLFAAAAAISVLSAASGARASTVTIGSPLTATFTGSIECNPPCTLAQNALPGALTASPISGTIVRWRVKAATGSAGFKLRVLRPAGFGAFTGVGTSAPGNPVSFGTQVFATDLPIQAGDLIGVEATSTTEKIGAASTAGGMASEWIPPLADGSTVGPVASTIPVELALNADVQPTPGVSTLSPATGPAAGGTAVTIAGHDFTGASAVSFGATPAASFTVDSETQITAVSPPGSPGTVDVRVTTIAGQSPVSAGDQFTYPGCHVPNLKGKSLKKAKKILKAASCVLGKVKPKGETKGKVKKQSPKAGAVLPVGSKVNLKLGK